jgi:hypothetical protein
MINFTNEHISYFTERTFLKPRTMIPTSGNDRKRPDTSEKITVSSRKASEIDGKRKQYSGPEDRRIIR